MDMYFAAVKYLRFVKGLQATHDAMETFLAKVGRRGTRIKVGLGWADDFECNAIDQLYYL